MPETPSTPKECLDSLPEGRRKALRRTRTAVNKGLPKGYREGIHYGMIGWFVPHRVYPDGYHCDPKQPLPFAGPASRKNYMSLHLMCIYSDENHRAWFEREWAKTGRIHGEMGLRSPAPVTAPRLPTCFPQRSPAALEDRPPCRPCRQSGNVTENLRVLRRFPMPEPWKPLSFWSTGRFLLVSQAGLGFRGRARGTWSHRIPGQIEGRSHVPGRSVPLGRASRTK